MKHEIILFKTIVEPNGLVIGNGGNRGYKIGIPNFFKKEHFTQTRASSEAEIGLQKRHKKYSTSIPD